MKIDVVVSQLLCSRLCHDLVGPSGGINAGIELMAEDGSDGSALHLIGKSAEQMSRCLAFFRIAFGFASGEGATDVDEVRALANGRTRRCRSDRLQPAGDGDAVGAGRHRRDGRGGQRWRARARGR